MLCLLFCLSAALGWAHMLEQTPELSNETTRSNGGQVFKLTSDFAVGDVEVQFETEALGEYDHLKVHPGLNATAWDSWYFDAISTSSNESILILFNAQNAAFDPNFAGGQPPSTPYSITLLGTFADGTKFAKMMEADELVIVQEVDKSLSTSWNGAGTTFYGSSTLHWRTTYRIEIDAPAHGIQGTMELETINPAHFACGVDAVGTTEMLVPSLAWSNAQPDADAMVSVTIDDKQLHFRGNGYHDKVWGSQPISPATLQSYYFGHARVGEHSFVWTSVRLQDGSILVSGYVAHAGEILLSSCDTSAVQVATWGENSAFPPVPGMGLPQGMSAMFSLANGDAWVVNMTTSESVVATDYAFFGLGSVMAGLRVNELVEEGSKGIWQVLQFPIL